MQVHSYASIEDSVILPNVDIARNVHLRKVVIDKHCRIPEGMRIGFDTREDRKRFHVSDKGVTLVTPEMLDQRVHHIF